MKPSTNSKQYFPVIKSAKGKWCWDVNDRKYLDWTGSNLTVIHGYRRSVASVPNLPGQAQCEQTLSKLLSNYTGTHHFRYYKNGSDAVNNAVRMAFNLIDAGSIAYLGYSGSNDLYTYTFNSSGLNEYEYINPVQIHPNDLSEIYYVKPDGTSNPNVDILVFESRYADIADKIEAKIKICDTLKDGIRALYFYHGDKETYAINSGYDFYTYGKSIANGSALAVLTGKNEYMKRIDEVYYSTTFGCNQDAMLEAIRTIKGFEKVKEKYFQLLEYANLKLPKWYSANPDEIKWFLDRGIIWNGYWQLMTCHTKRDIDNLVKELEKWHK